MAMKARPSASSISYIVQMFGWFREDAALASRWKRLRACWSLASSSGRNSWIQAHGSNRHPIQNRVEDHSRRVASKWQRARAHFIQHSAEREQVGAGIEFLPLNLLGRHVSDRAECCAGAGKVLLRADGRVAHGNVFRLQRHFRKPEIENLRLTSIRDEDVRWLDVPVDDSFRMCRVERIGDLDAQIEHRLDFQRLAIDL